MVSGTVRYNVGKHLGERLVERLDEGVWSGCWWNGVLVCLWFRLGCSRVLRPATLFIVVVVCVVVVVSC